MKNGILAVNKPEGISSARVVSRLKKALGVKKIGHTGTLDPFATGLLLIALGKATRISRFFLDGSKRYRARVRLGRETDTYDCTGEVVARADASILKSITQDQVRQVVAGFHGAQEQVAPSYSALKHQGQPLYKLARQGKMIQKPPRRIEIYQISVTSMDLPGFEIDVHCSGGTYIRSLAYDMGKQLNCGAHLSGLRRTGSGQFQLTSASDLEVLETMDRAEVEKHITPMSDCLYFLPRAVVGKDLESKVRYGQKLTADEIRVDRQGESCSPIRVVDNANELLALVEPDKSGRFYNYCCVLAG